MTREVFGSIAEKLANIYTINKKSKTSFKLTEIIEANKVLATSSLQDEMLSDDECRAHYEPQMRDLSHYEAAINLVFLGR